MQHDVETVEQLAAREAEQLASSIAAQKITIGDGGEAVYQHADCVVVVMVKPVGWKPPKKRKPRKIEPHPDDDTADLPKAIHNEVRAVKRTYRLIRAFREVLANRDRKLLSKELRVEDRKERKDKSLSIHTIGHALTVLKKYELIEKEKWYGWRLMRPKLEITPSEDETESETSAAPEKAEPDPLPWCEAGLNSYGGQLASSGRRSTAG